MNKVLVSDVQPLKVHQCLFGYHDGHRLLASSTKLPDDSKSLLLLMSDLSPGITLPINVGYWTGIPLPEMKAYALMCTWAAPEMPRPGCVWTQALFIPFAEIGRIQDLRHLAKLMQRPNKIGVYSSYEIAIQMHLDSDMVLKPYSHALSEQTVFRAVRALYNKSGQGEVGIRVNELDPLIFALWSQQWPRLRRSFSFRTAANISKLGSGPKKFNLTFNILDAAEISIEILADKSSPSSWEQLASKDIVENSESDYRKFLWRYGSDVPFSRKRFQFLSEVYLDTRRNDLAGKQLRTVMGKITKELPTVSEGKVLKSDLLRSSQYSMVPAINPIDVLAFYVSDIAVNSLLLSPSELINVIDENWLSRKSDILEIAENAAMGSFPYFFEIIKHIAQLILPSEFFASTSSTPTVRKLLVKLNPVFLDCEPLINQDSLEILELLNAITIENRSYIKQIIPRLLLKDDAEMAAEILDNFTELALPVTVDAMESSIFEKRITVAPAWITAVSTHCVDLINSGIIERCRTTTAMAFFTKIAADTVNANSQIGPLPWAVGLKNINDDLRGETRDWLMLFLLKFALRQPVHGSEPIFEYAFAEVHSNIMFSKYDWETTKEVQDILPTLPWPNNWDNCRRLRLAVATAYIKSDLQIESYLRLSSNIHLSDDMKLAAREAIKSKKTTRKIRTKRNRT